MISTVSFLEIDSVFDINNTFKTWRGKSLQLPYVNEAKFWPLNGLSSRKLPGLTFWVVAYGRFDCDCSSASTVQ